MPRLTQEQKRTTEFVGLSRRFHLALEQAGNAFDAGYPKIGQGVLRQAADIHRQIKEFCREEKYMSLLKEHGQKVTELFSAMASGKTEKSKQLAEAVAVIETQIAAA